MALSACPRDIIFDVHSSPNYSIHSGTKINHLIAFKYLTIATEKAAAGLKTPPKSYLIVPRLWLEFLV